MATRQTQTDMVREYIELLQAERRKLTECLENIGEYANRLRAAAMEAQQRLIGRD